MRLIIRPHAHGPPTCSSYEEKGDYAAARWAYDQAYACSPRADLMLSIGRASEGAGDIPSAIAAYACVLGPGRSDDDTRMKGS